ncbi:DUF4129 domain-containing protein [Mucilaginibacter lacusdianchii]|uniref:DUF4129 domain-containing protein n=1 Tax=Mucilaginibacter lacusdianchii TaxID=2684211 RepID=UPI00131BF67F|nr:DUF4129 domain-containing protein [Mucilaginibacter sp. JXJ CY 39]
MHTGFVLAAAVPKPKITLRTDSSVITPRYLSKSYLDSCRKLPVFQYDEAKAEPSLWTRFWRWFWHLFDGMTPDKKNVALYYLVIIFKYLFITIGIAALVFLILRLIGVDILSIIKKKPVSAEVPYNESLENIHEINFDDSIEQAISQHNYRLAVRLLYLKSLKQLNDAGLIHWQIDKTNSTYISELQNIEQREAFTVLTRQFEYVWYGEFTINGQVFQNINTLFTHFKQTLA